MSISFKTRLSALIKITAAAILILAFSFAHIPKDIVQVAAAQDMIESTSESLPEAPQKTEEQLLAISKTDVYAGEMTQGQVFVEMSELDDTVNGDYVELDEHSDNSASMWVDGERVPLSVSEIAELYRRIYATTSYQEYSALLKTIGHLNGGVDTDKLTWLIGGDQFYLDIPDVAGMTKEDAKTTLRNAQLDVYCKYIYNPDCELPPGYCYAQDPSAGHILCRTPNITIYIQTEGPEQSYGPAGPTPEPTPETTPEG